MNEKFAFCRGPQIYRSFGFFGIAQVSRFRQICTTAPSIMSSQSIRISYPINGNPARKLESPIYEAAVMLQAGHPLTITESTDQKEPKILLFLPWKPEEKYQNLYEDNQKNTLPKSTVVALTPYSSHNVEMPRLFRINSALVKCEMNRNKVPPPMKKNVQYTGETSTCRSFGEIMKKKGKRSIQRITPISMITDFRLIRRFRILSS